MTRSTRPASGRAASSALYRRRNLVPASIIAALLVLAGIATWAVVLTNSSASHTVACNQPSRPGGTSQPREALDGTQAAPPGDVRVTVYNAAGQRGQAQLAGVELGELGMGQAAPPDNDPLYPGQNLTCVGQIRYGPAGATAARTLSLAVPCAELVADRRPGNDVGLALGSDFRDVAPDRGVVDALHALSRNSAAGPGAPGTDPASLTALRSVDCST